MVSALVTTLTPARSQADFSALQQAAAQDRQQALVGGNRRRLDDLVAVVALLEVRAVERTFGGFFQAPRASSTRRPFSQM